MTQRLAVLSGTRPHLKLSCMTVVLSDEQLVQPATSIAQLSRHIIEGIAYLVRGVTHYASFIICHKESLFTMALQSRTAR